MKCIVCDKEINSKKSKRKYCSKKCFGIARRKRIYKKCKTCGKMMYVKKCSEKTKNYCSTKCLFEGLKKRKERKCQKCGENFYPPKENTKYCSLKCYYDSCDKSYKEIAISSLTKEEQEKFSLMLKNKNSIHTHRIVMAKHLDRPLDKNELVHHKDGNRHNNNLENLELLDKAGHHKGHGDIYYQKWQEVEAQIRELEKQLAQKKITS